MKKHKERLGRARKLRLIEVLLKNSNLTEKDVKELIKKVKGMTS